MVCVWSRFCLYKVSLTDIQEINSGTPECLVGFFSDLLLQRLIYSTVKICDFQHNENLGGREGWKLILQYTEFNFIILHTASPCFYPVQLISLKAKAPCLFPKGVFLVYLQQGSGPEEEVCLREVCSDGHFCFQPTIHQVLLLQRCL